MIDYYMGLTSELSLILAIVTFLSSLIFGYFSKRRVSLEQALTNALAAAMIPTGIALILCSFNIEKISQIEGLSLIISIAGLTILYTSINSILDTIKKGDSKINNTL